MKKENGPVLIVDDDPAYTYFLEEALNRCPQPPAVHVLHRATDLLDWLARNPRPSLILLDVHMPRLNGFRLLALLKEQAPYQDIPMVMMTVVSDRPSVVRAYQYGASAYIIKPSSVAQLHRRLELLSGFWQVDESVTRPNGPSSRQEFEHHLSQYRRVVFERLQRWQTESRDARLDGLMERSGDTHYPITQIVNRFINQLAGWRAGAAPAWAVSEKRCQRGLTRWLLGTTEPARPLVNASGAYSCCVIDRPFQAKVGMAMTGSYEPIVFGKV